MTHEEQLALVRKQIESSELGIEKQRRIIRGLEARAGSAVMAGEMLRVLEANLRARRADYSYLMAKTAPQSARSNEDGAEA